MRDAATGRLIDAGPLDVSAVHDAGRGPSTPRPPDARWRVALDEVVRRLDRGDAPARVAQVFGRVVATDSEAVRIESTQSWTPAVELRRYDDELLFLITMEPRLPVRELDAALGTCGAGPFGKFGDGALIACPPFATRRGTMVVSAITDPSGGDGHASVIDSLMFNWTPSTRRVR